MHHLSGSAWRMRKDWLMAIIDRLIFGAHRCIRICTFKYSPFVLPVSIFPFTSSLIYSPRPGTQTPAAASSTQRRPHRPPRLSISHLHSPSQPPSTSPSQHKLPAFRLTILTTQPPFPPPQHQRRSFPPLHPLASFLSPIAQ